jgi:hypothetical protein
VGGRAPFGVGGACMRVLSALALHGMRMKQACKQAVFLMSRRALLPPSLPCVSFFFRLQTDRIPHTHTMKSAARAAVGLGLLGGAWGFVAPASGPATLSVPRLRQTGAAGMSMAADRPKVRWGPITWLTTAAAADWIPWPLPSHDAACVPSRLSSRA